MCGKRPFFHPYPHIIKQGRGSKRPFCGTFSKSNTLTVVFVLQSVHGRDSNHKMNPLTANYENGLKASLADPKEAAAYLNAALEENDQEVFLLALRDITEARGFSQVAQDASLNRENLYRMLSSNGNPQLSSLKTLLHSMGLRLAIEVEAV